MKNSTKYGTYDKRLLLQNMTFFKYSFHLYKLILLYNNSPTLSTSKTTTTKYGTFLIPKENFFQYQFQLYNFGFSTSFNTYVIHSRHTKNMRYCKILRLKCSFFVLYNGEKWLIPIRYLSIQYSFQLQQGCNNSFCIQPLEGGTR